MNYRSLGTRKCGKLNWTNGDKTNIFWIIDTDHLIIIYEDKYFFNKFHETVIKVLKETLKFEQVVIPYIAIKPAELKYTT